MTSEALNADLEAARAGAIAAFELECRGDLRAAAAGFAQVRSQLLYLADVCIPNALPELGEACRAVLQVLSAHSVRRVVVAAAIRAGRQLGVGACDRALPQVWATLSALPHRRWTRAAG